MKHLSLGFIEGSRLKRQSGILRQEVKGGLSKSRKDIIGSPSIKPVKLELNHVEFTKWENFYLYVINEGDNEFTMDMILNEWEIKRVVVKIIKDPTEIIKGLTAIVDFTVQIKRPTDFESKRALAEVRYIYGDDLVIENILNLLEDLCNNKFIGS